MAAGIGSGLTVAIHDGASTFNTIGSVDRMSYQDGQLDVHEVTDFQTASFRKAFLAGLLDTGELSFEGFWDGSTYQAQIRTDMAARTARQFRFTFPSSVGATTDQFTLTGLITQFNIPNVAPNEPMRFNCTVKVTTAATIA